MVWTNQPNDIQDDGVGTHKILEDEVCSHKLFWCPVNSCLLSSRTWREMRSDFQLKGGEQVEVSDDTRTQPLSMEDCMGVFFLWLLILITGLVGLVSWPISYLYIDI